MPKALVNCPKDEFIALKSLWLLFCSFLSIVRFQQTLSNLFRPRIREKAAKRAKARGEPLPVYLAPEMPPPQPVVGAFGPPPSYVRPAFGQPAGFGAPPSPASPSSFVRPSNSGFGPSPTPFSSSSIATPSSAQQQQHQFNIEEASVS